MIVFFGFTTGRVYHDTRLDKFVGTKNPCVVLSSTSCNSITERCNTNTLNNHAYYMQSIFQHMRLGFDDPRQNYCSFNKKEYLQENMVQTCVCVRARVCVGHFVFFVNNQNQCDFFYLHEGDQRRDLPLPELGLKPKSLAWGLDMSTP